jgi:serine/threonine protein kinase
MIKGKDSKEKTIEAKLLASPSKSYKVNNNSIYKSKTSSFNSEKSSNSNNVVSNLKISLRDFEILKVIGRGSFGRVLLVKCHIDKKLYAMKVLSKDKLIKTHQIFHTKTEREIMERVSHPFIIRMHFAFQSEYKLYLVTEFMQGGELFYHIKKNGIFGEEQARMYTCEIILALEYLHSEKIIYRDLKPENILLGKDGHIKITDFGLSKLFMDEDKAYTICGTPEYLAPEILLGKGYDKSVDWWCLGILIYEMMLEGSPYRKNILDINNYMESLNIREGLVSQEARDLILSLLKIDPTERLGYGFDDASEIKSHPFFRNVDWKGLLEKKIKPKFIPSLRNDLDLEYFDKIFTDESVNDFKDIRRGGRFRNHKPLVYENFSFVLKQ